MYQSSFAGEPDWQRDEDALFEASIRVLKQFATDNPDQIVSAFGFDSEPCYGYALIAIETPATAFAVAADRETRQIENRYRYFARADAWKRAKSYTSREAIDYSDSTGYFAYPNLETVQFSGWEVFANGDSYPEPDKATNPDYMEGHACLMFWRVSERLIAQGAFDALKLWTPFRIGFNFHDERFVTLRMLNRPTAPGG